jgi:hypothetical protein
MSLQEQHTEGYCAAVAETDKRETYKTGAYVILQWLKKLLRNMGTPLKNSNVLAAL